MVGLMKRLFGGSGTKRPAASSAGFSDPRIVGVWAPVQGDPKETIEYRADGTVRMAMFGGLSHMDGRYRFTAANTVQIDWLVKADSDADEALASLNASMASRGSNLQARVVNQSVLQVTLSDTELRTLHVEKGRRGHFRRVLPAATAATAAPPPAAAKPNTMAIIARCYLLGQRTIPDCLRPDAMAGLGNAAIENVRQIEGIELDFSPKSLAILDQILHRFHRAGDTPNSIPQTLLVFGAFAGEVLIRNHGGNWAYRSDTSLAGTAGPSLVVELPNGSVCDPIGKVLEIVTEATDSLLFYYAMTAVG